MPHYRIHGGFSLQGTVAVRGAKNGALKALAASLLSDKPMRIFGVPDIEDVRRQVELLELLGYQIVWDKAMHEILVTPSALPVNPTLPSQTFGKLRGSMALIGPLLARCGQVTFPDPGGCSIGMRPIDKFLTGFTALGATIQRTENSYTVTAPSGGLMGARIIFTNISVVATETMMMAAALAHGTTELVNAACEPEIPILAAYLNECGASIAGAGTSRIVINGVSDLSCGTFHNIPDRLESAFWTIVGCATRSQLTITDCNPFHLEVTLELLKQMGARISWDESTISVAPHDGLVAVDFKTHEYPGIATDVQPFLTVLATQARGQALIHETIFESRLAFAADLNRMGASVTVCDPHRIIVHGPQPLHARELVCPDARAGTAYLIAGLIASGTTTLSNIYQLERGFENIPDRLLSVGAEIARMP